MHKCVRNAFCVGFSCFSFTFNRERDSDFSSFFFTRNCLVWNYYHIYIYDDKFNQLFNILFNFIFSVTDQQFPIDLSSVEKDHPFLEKDPLQSLFRRLAALNRYATMRLDGQYQRNINVSTLE